MHNILEEIITKKRVDLIEQKKLNPVNKDSTATFQNDKFKNAIKNSKKPALIAEIKLASPTIPSLGSKEEIISRVRMYEKAGANAISFITEKHFFKGDITFIPKLKEATRLPIIQKDFVIDEYQLYEAAHAGADAILLIAKLITTTVLHEFVILANKLGIEPVVEINDQEDLDKAMKSGTRIIAVNARDLQTFGINVKKACELLQQIPASYIKLGFSGIKSNSEVADYKTAGADGVLVGTSLMKAKSVEEFIQSLRL